jgi:hypothetical protein
VTEPSRFHASPAEIDAFLRANFAEDVLLNFYRAVGDEVLDEALQHGRQYRGVMESRNCKHVYLAGMADVMDEIWDYRYYPAKLPKLGAYNRPFNPPREEGPERECGRTDTHGAHRFEYQGRFIKCPGYDHANHVHAFDTVIGAWPDGPDGETGTLKQCWCGATRTEDALGSRESGPKGFDALLDASSLGAPHVKAAREQIPEDVRERLAEAARAASAPEPENTPCYRPKAHDAHDWLKGRRRVHCLGHPR